MHAELGHVVDGGARVGAATGHRGEVHDVASPAPGDQRQRGVRAVEEPQQVHADHPAPLVRVLVRERAEQHHAGVVDEDVEPAKLMGGGLHEAGGLFLVRHVRLLDERGPLEPLGERLEPIGPAGPERHRRARFRQGSRRCLAYS
jgi:hypothetical protein